MKQVLSVILMLTLIGCTSERLVRQSTPCGNLTEQEKIRREACFSGKTPEWVPVEVRKSYNVIEKASWELLEIKCAEYVLEEAWITKLGSLKILVKRNTLKQEIDLGRIPNLESVEIIDNKLKLTYKTCVPSLRESIKSFVWGVLSGGGFVAFLILL